MRLNITTLCVAGLALAALSTFYVCETCLPSDDVPTEHRPETTKRQVSAREPDRNAGPARTLQGHQSVEAGAGTLIRVRLASDSSDSSPGWAHERILLVRDDKTVGFLTTDSRGYIQVLRDRCPTRLEFENGVEFAELDVSRASNRERVLVAKRRRGIAVRVLSTLGEKVGGLPVALAIEETGRLVKVAQSVTDGRGHAVLSPHRIQEGSTAPMFIVLDALLASPVKVKVIGTQRRTSVDPMVIRIPETGRVQVRLTGLPSLNPAAGLAGTVELISRETSSDHGLLRELFHSVRRLSNGAIEFSHVEIGLPLTVIVWAPALPSANVIRQPCLGPDSPSSPSRVTVSIALPRLEGRLVHESGQCIGRTEAKYRILYFCDREPENRRSEGWRSFRTDADGKFSFVPHLHSPRSQTITERVIEILASDPLLRLGSVPINLPTPIPRGRHDLGDVRIPVRPRIATGRVLDSGGRPVIGAEVRVEYEYRTGPDEAVWVDRATDQRGDALGGCTSTENGGFELFGVIQGLNVRLTATKKGFICVAPMKIAEHDRGSPVVIRLTRISNLRGVLLCDPNIDRSELVVRYRATVGGHWKNVDYVMALDGRFSAKCLPGTYDLSVFLRKTGEIVSSLRGVSTTSSKLCLDLRGKLCCFDITIVDREGRALTRAKVHRDNEAGTELGAADLYPSVVRLIYPEGGSWGGKSIDESPTSTVRSSSSSKTIRVLAIGQGVDIRISEPSKKTRRIANARVNQVVVLEDGEEVRVQLRSASGPPQGYEFRAYPSYPGRPGSARFLVFDKAGRTSFRVSDKSYRESFRVALVRVDGVKGVLLKCRILDSKSDGSVSAELLESIDDALKRER